LFRVAEDVAKWSDQELYLNLGQPKMEDIEILDYSPFGPHTPPQLVAPIDNVRFTSSAFLQEDMLLIDFGQSFPFLAPP
jgi:serine/threonine-protein kinase SRPK3